MDLEAHQRIAEDRARRFGHVLGAWTPVQANGKACNASRAPCLFCAASAFAQPRITHFGNTAARACTTCVDLFARVAEAA